MRKIIYFHSGSWAGYFEELIETESISGIDVLTINAKRYNNPYHQKDEHPRDSDHFITYDYEDIRFGSLGISARSPLDDYMLLDNKVLGRIKENDEIILVCDFCDFEYPIEYFLYLREKINFTLHIIGLNHDKFHSGDFHQYLRSQFRLDLICSICYFDTSKIYFSFDEADEERTRKKLIRKLYTAVAQINELNKDKFYIYNYKENKYIETIRPKFTSSSMFEFVTPSKSENMCQTLYEYRKAFADKHNLEYKQKPCSQCKCNSLCVSVCDECDGQADELWGEVYKYKHIIIDGKEYCDGRIEYEHDEEITANINGIDRMRINTDGNGIRTLVLMAGCPLKCKYCGNKKYKDIFPSTEKLDVDRLGYYLEEDGVYFEMTNGGVTFGGGEPLLWSAFIHEFHKSKPMWSIVVETSLYVNFHAIELLAEDIDYWYIDIKDMNPEIYRKYTGKDNSKMIGNLQKILTIIPNEKICIRVPRIPGFNTDTDVENSLKKIENLGFKTIEVFDYKM